MSLHAKTLAMDRERIFIGSFNFDPRSVIYNTELGLVIRSPTQCASMKVDILNGWSVKATRLLQLTRCFQRALN